MPSLPKLRFKSSFVFVNPPAFFKAFFCLFAFFSNSFPFLRIASPMPISPEVNLVNVFEVFFWKIASILARLEATCCFEAWARITCSRFSVTICAWITFNSFVRSAIVVSVIFVWLASPAILAFSWISNFLIEAVKSTVPFFCSFTDLL